MKRMTINSSTIACLINTDFKKSSIVPTNDLCEDFADHFRGRIDGIRSTLLGQNNVAFNRPEPLLLSVETMEHFVLVDAESAAFDSVDHHILVNRLRCLVGLSGTVFN